MLFEKLAIISNKSVYHLGGVKLVDREEKYASSQASSISTISEYLRYLRKKNLPLPKFITLTPVTNPFLSHKTLKKAFIKLKNSKKIESIIGITEGSEHPFLSVKIDKKIKFNVFKINGKSGADFERSQDVPKNYIQSASFRISRVNYFLKYISNKKSSFSRSTFNEKSCTYIKIKKIENFDINSLEDLRHARIIKA